MSIRPAAAAVFLAILYCGGCAGIPFKEVSYAPVGKIEPAKAREQFRSDLPSRFQLISTIVFKYGWRNFSAIGYTAVDSENKTFTVVGLTPVGIKLFELSGDNGNVECRFALEEFTRKGNFAGMVAEDIRRIYFDRVPDADAVAHKEKDRIIFRKPVAEGTLEYIFAGENNSLIEKRCLVDDQKIWAVFYYEYIRKDGKLHPAGIIFKNYRYGYQLTTKLKEIRLSE